MDKLNGQSMDLKSKNIQELKKLFPNAVTEGRIDFEKLKLLLGEEIGDSIEKYQFTWNGKSKAIKLAQMPSTATLRPSKEDSVDWDTTENLYIEGDNLEVLKQLQKTYFGKIKMIYIDPPYNTGGDFVYKDDFKDSLKNYKEQTNQSKSSNAETSGRYHTDWLNMMYPRLMLSKNLLSEDGAIFISIDDSEISELTLICNQIFGETNYINTIIVESDSRKRPYSSISSTHEYILMYQKSEKFETRPLVNEDKKFKYQDNIGGFDIYELRNRNVDFNISNRPNLFYPFYVNPNNNVDNDFYEISLEKKEGFIEVLPQKSKGIQTVWRWGKDTARNELNKSLVGYKSGTNWRIVKKYRENTYVLGTVWTDNEVKSDRGTLEIKPLVGNRVFSFPKPTDLIMRTLKLITSNDDIILDFFSGSASSAHAVLKLNAKDCKNRKFIMVQLPEKTEEKSEAYKAGYRNICEIGKERIRRAGQQIKQELIDKKNKAGMIDVNVVDPDTLNIGFKVFKLDDTNIKAWDSSAEVTKESLLDQVEVIKENRSIEDVLYEILLKYGVFNHTVKEITINNKTMYDIADGYMIVNLSDKIEDTDVKEITKRSPHVVIFLESGFVNDNDKINAEATLKHNGVEDVKCI